MTTGKAARILSTSRLRSCPPRGSRGDGVVGEQPIINESESYSYTSGTEINTPTGFMSGTYKMQSKDGKFFNAKIPKFELQMPRTLH